MSYRDQYPDEQQLYQEFDNLRQYWQKRDQLAKEFREHMSGVNAVDFPANTRYKVRTMHTYLLAGHIGQKVARYMAIPKLQVVINDPLDLDERATGSVNERAINVAQYEMERLGDGDVWSRVMLDAILLDTGIERIERLQGSIWPLVVQCEEMLADEKVDQSLKDETYSKFGVDTKARENYKREKGLPIRSTYVPLEYCYPRYDGSIAVEVFELEPRSIYSVKNDPMFKSAVSDMFEEENNRTTEVIILHHDTPKYHAYYLMQSSQIRATDQARNFREQVNTSTGNLHFLAAYEHNLGRTQYNFVAGRLGGWKTANGGMIDLGKGLLHLNSVSDEVASQAFTNIRATEWPTMKFFVDPEKRGQPAEGTPNPPQLQEGQDITLYVGEDLLPVIEGKPNETIPWFFSFIEKQLTNLGGSAVLTGDNAPGVRTGYHNALQIAQAESVDEKIEQHASFGAINRGTLILLHCREIGEKVYVHYTERIVESGKTYKKGNYLCIDPSFLSPLPRLDAVVRAQRPVDTVASIRAAREATDERGGKGPLLSDDTARSLYMGVDEPDTEELKILIEKTKLQAIEAGLVLDKVRENLNLQLAKSGVPSANAQVVQGSDPALLAAVQGTTQQAAGAGGVNPHTLMQTQQTAGGAGLQPGMPTGQSQPEANAGTASNSDLAASLIQ